MNTGRMRAGAAIISVPLMAALLGISQSAEATQPRSRWTRAEFQRLHPCPSTGKRSGACPGYVKDHVTPLCAGGSDSPHNMQWQTIEDAKIKDVQERAQCRK